MEMTRKKAVLLGVAGSNNAFSLSLYNLKAYALQDLEIAAAWELKVIQHPLINHDLWQERTLPQINRLIDVVAAEKPDLLAFSCYMWNVKSYTQLAKGVRAVSPETLIVWGGPEMSRDWVVQGNFDTLEADFCVSGEGELTFLELLQNQTHGKPSLAEIPGLAFREAKDQPFVVNGSRAPFKSLDAIPSPYLNGIVDDEVLGRSRIEANLETQRGCSLRCSYCVYHKDMSKISYSTAERVLKEVEYVCARGVKHLRFVDANFSSDLPHAKAVIRGLIDNNVEAKIMFELIPGFLDEELAALFEEYNELHPWNELTLGVGVQTINLKVLRLMRRGIRLAKFEETFDLLGRHKIFAKIDLIIGLPGEDLASIERTLEYFLDRLRNSQNHLLCCHVMRGLPGTELLEIAREHDMVFSSERETHELIESTLLPRREMLKCLRRAAIVFRLVNYEGWVHREFLSGRHAEDTSLRDCFFLTRDRLGVSNTELVDRITEELIPHLAKRESNFAHPDFPFAETWWWARAKSEVSNKWLVECMEGLTAREVHSRSPVAHAVTGTVGSA
jgi:radical SAM superfamily enzyme YgiQ (UPF0313 family)